MSSCRSVARLAWVSAKGLGVGPNPNGPNPLGQNDTDDNINSYSYLPSVVTGMSGVLADVEPGQVVSGIPAIPHRQHLRELAAVGHLPALRQEVRKLQEELEALKKKVTGG